MGHAGEQLSHRRQLLTLTQSLLRSLPFLSEAALLQDHGRLIGESGKTSNVIGAEQPPLRCAYIEDPRGLAVRSQRYPEKPVQTDGLGGPLMAWLVTLAVDLLVEPRVLHGDRCLVRQDFEELQFFRAEDFARQFFADQKDPRDLGFEL